MRFSQSVPSNLRTFHRSLLTQLLSVSRLIVVQPLAGSASWANLLVTSLGLVAHITLTASAPQADARRLETPSQTPLGISSASSNNALTLDIEPKTGWGVVLGTGWNPCKTPFSLGHLRPAESQRA